MRMVAPGRLHCRPQRQVGRPDTSDVPPRTAGPGVAGALSNPETAATITDEASAIEAIGHRPRLVAGDYENIKVTWPGDFALAERLLRTRG